MNRHAILNGHEVIPCTFDEFVLCNMYAPEKSHERIVKQTKIGEVLISTVFLGINHSWGGEPIWFETMIFGGQHDGHQTRCSTWDEAEKQHEEAEEIGRTIYVDL